MDNFSLNTLDLAILGVLFLSALFAWGRGLVRELFSLLAWVGAALVLVHGFGPARPFAHDVLAVPVLTDVGLAIVLFIGALLLFSFIGRRVAGRVKESKLKPIDRGLGLFFGLARGVILVSFLYLLFGWMVPPRDQPGALGNSVLLPFVGFGASLLSDLVPDAQEKEGREAMEAAKEKTEETIVWGRVLRFFDSKSTEAEGESGYTEQDRGAMERLIKNLQ